jgi:hypothetical protein
MSYESRAYDHEDGDPVVVLVAKGPHDVSRLTHLLSGGQVLVEQMLLGETIRRQVRRHNGGRAALALLRQHGGSDFTAEDATRAPHTVTVTHLAPGFDPSDQRRFEYIVHTEGRTVSHLVQHPDACHSLDYGQECWFDFYWESGPYSYDDEAPGVYTCTPQQELVGTPDGQDLDDVLDYIHYERTGDVPPPVPAEADQADAELIEAPF